MEKVDNWEWLQMDIDFHLDDRRVLELDSGWLHNPKNILKNIEVYTLKGWILWDVNYISKNNEIMHLDKIIHWH